jgi:cytochrome P450
MAEESPEKDKLTTDLSEIERLVREGVIEAGTRERIAGEFVSLCFSSANFDASVFDAPDAVQLDRRPNPHVAFGFGPHLCLGAAHARLVVRTLLNTLCNQVARIDVLERTWKSETEPSYVRRLAAERLEVAFVRR